jgi:hypothetical protein
VEFGGEELGTVALVPRSPEPEVNKEAKDALYPRHHICLSKMALFFGIAFTSVDFGAL